MSDVYVPHQTLEVTLSSFPVKPLLLLASASKSLHSRIHSKEFLRQHLNESEKTNSHGTIIVGAVPGNNRILYLDLDSFSRLDIVQNYCRTSFTRRLDIGLPEVQNYCIAGSCNGLVLLYANKEFTYADHHRLLYDYDDLFLWNPATRQIRTLPRTPVPEVRDPDSFFPPVVKLALGYDSLNDDYKIVRVVQGLSGQHRFSEMKIYSLNTNSWRTLDDFPYRVPRDATWGAYLNGSLHTVNDHYDGIMAFSLAQENHFEVPKPECEGIFESVNVLGGRLCVVVPRVVNGNINSSDIWVMTEYGVRESWTKLMHLCPETSLPSSTNRYWVTPVALLKSGNDVLLNYFGSHLRSYDLKEQRYSCVGANDGDGGIVRLVNEEWAAGSGFNAVMCIQSLVSPLAVQNEAVQENVAVQENEAVQNEDEENEAVRNEDEENEADQNDDEENEDV